MISASYLRSILHYDSDDGLWTWLVNKDSLAKIGDIAGCLRPDGYVQIGIDGRKYMAHQLAFFYMTGRWAKRVDHKDRDPANNKWSNLREATQTQNRANSIGKRDSESGIKGVCWYAPTNKWRAAIQRDGVRHHLGYFKSKQDAAAAYRKAANKLFGEFARAA